MIIMPKIAELVWLWVKRRPYVQEALEKKLVNYSALARLINVELKASPAAVKAALRRISRRLAKERIAAEQRVLTVLRGSSLEVKNKIAVVIARERLDVPVIASAKGPSGYTHIVEESMLPKIKRKNIVETQRNLDLITITSSREIQTVPGVITYLLNTLSAENINLLHITSCYLDTLLVLRDVDTVKAFELLTQKLRR